MLASLVQSPSHHRLLMSAVLRPTGAFITAFVVVCFIYSLGFRYVGAGDTRPAELLPISILEHGTTSFEHLVAPPLPYFVVEGQSGRVFSRYPLVAGLFNLATFLVAHGLGVDVQQNSRLLSSVTSIWVSALAAALLLPVLLRLGFSMTLSALAVGYFSFGTVMWSVVSRGLWQHGPVLVFLHSALLLFLYKRVNFGALLLGCCVISRPQCLLLVSPLLICEIASAWRSSWSRAFILVCSALAPIALQQLYFSLVVGSPFFLMNTGIHGVGGFSGDPFQGMAGLLINPSRGLFIFSPVFLLGVFGAAWWWRQLPAILRPLIVGSALLVVMTSFWSVWWGGHSFGYRIVSEIASPLTIASTFAVSRLRSIASISVVSLLAVWSVGLGYLGARYQPCGWNTKPEPIQASSERLWSVTNSEISLCMRRWYQRNKALEKQGAGETRYWRSTAAKKHRTGQMKSELRLFSPLEVPPQ